MNEILANPILTVTFIVMGLTLIAMLAIPIVPGQVIIWLAALIFAFLAGWDTLGWGTFILLTVLMVTAGLTNEVGRWFGAKGGGASWSAILIGLLLGFIGMLIFELPGAIIGALLGITWYEYRKDKDWKRSFKAAAGYVAGLLASFAVRFMIAVVMVVIFAVRVL